MWTNPARYYVTMSMVVSHDIDLMCVFSYYIVVLLSFFDKQNIRLNILTFLTYIHYITKNHLYSTKETRKISTDGNSTTSTIVNSLL